MGGLGKVMGRKDGGLVGCVKSKQEKIASDRPGHSIMISRLTIPRLGRQVKEIVRDKGTWY